MVPDDGFEPPTISLQVSSSTVRANPALVTPTGLEPVIFRVKGVCVNQLHQGAIYLKKTFSFLITYILYHRFF